MVPSPRIDAAVAAGTRDFLEAWYGPPPNPIVDVPGDAPDALRQWWACERAWGRKLTNQNSVLSQDELFEDSDQTVFYVENQAVMFWGYEGTGDPPVSERVTDVDAPWVQLDIALSAFLSHVAVLEASFGPNVVIASGIERPQLDRLTDGLTELPPSIWPSAHMYAGQDLLVNAHSDSRSRASADTWTVMVSAPSADRLGAVDEALPYRWDYDSRTDG